MATEREDRVTRIWCGPDGPPRGKQSNYGQILSTIPPNVNVFLKVHNISDRLAKNLSANSLDLLEIAAYIYAVDQSKTRGGRTFPQNGLNWYRQFELSLPVRQPEIWNKPDVKEKLIELLRFMSNDDYQFIFRKLTADVPHDAYIEFESGKPWFRPDSILLFSGGLDSLTGAVEELQERDRKVLLVSHRAVSKIDRPQRNLVATIKENYNAKQRLLHVPVWVNKYRGLTRDTNQRSRSFLYASIATVIAMMTESREIKFYENGIVSCNLPISAQLVEARASRSTHPKTLRLMSEFFSALTENQFNVVNPFFRKTKSDVVKTLVSYRGKNLIRQARSCTRTMGATKLHTHCGTCSQCIERRLATLFNRVEECDPEEMYKTELFLGSLEKSDDRQMVADYVQHARHLETVDIDDFFQRFPDGFNIVRAVNLPSNQAGQMLFELHQRHGQQIGKVIRLQIERHAEDIRNGQIPTSSLLAFVLKDSSKMQVTLPPNLRFPTPPGATWKDVEIAVVSHESVRITVAGITKRYTGFDMGFRDGRRVDLLNKQWQLLETFASNNGVLNWSSQKTIPNVQKRVQALRKLLCRFFGVSGSPITNYSKMSGYVTRFRISDEIG